MEDPAVRAIRDAAQSGHLPTLQNLLAANPALATADLGMGRTALNHAALYGWKGAVRLLLEAAPAMALVPDDEGCLPLHYAAFCMNAGVAQLLLDAAPTAVMVPDVRGQLPLHMATQHYYWGGQLGEEALRLLLEAAPVAALTADAEGRLPLHMAASRNNSTAVRLLLAAAPAAASVRGGEPPWVPLMEALRAAAVFYAADPDCDLARHLAPARLLLPATPADDALDALVEARQLYSVGGELALPLLAELAASRALSPAQWQRFLVPCPGLGAALPAVLSRSEAEARSLVSCLPAEERRRLRAGALALGRAQRARRVELPGVLVGRVLGLAAAGCSAPSAGA